MKILSDNPTNAKNDWFGYSNYADTLADIIQGVNETPFTIGIFGKWGSGKTSLMKMVEEKITRISKEHDGDELCEEFTGEHSEVVFSKPFKDKIRYDAEKGCLLLKGFMSRKEKSKLLKLSKDGSYVRAIEELYKKSCNRPRTKTMWFNPWKYDNKEAIWSALVQSILSEMAGDKEYLKNQTKNDRKKILGKIKKIVIQFTWCAAGVGAQHLTGGMIGPRFVTDFKKAFKSDGERYKFVNEFEDTFKKLTEDYVGKEGKIVIFIDDLDRCVPENAITALEALKLYLDKSRCVFIIGADRAMIETGITHRYSGKIKEFTGKDYLEKIIQLPFAIPPIAQSTFEQILDNSEKLETLPKEITGFPTELKEKIRYDSRRRSLILTGIMTNDEKNQLQELSNDTEYRRVIEELFKKPSLGEEVDALTNLFTRRLRGVLVQGAKYNPRRLKRILNSIYTIKELQEIDNREDLEILGKILLIQTRFPTFFEYILKEINKGNNAISEYHLVCSRGKEDYHDITCSDLNRYIEDENLKEFMENTCEILCDNIDRLKEIIYLTERVT